MEYSQTWINVWDIGITFDNSNSLDWLTDIIMEDHVYFFILLIYVMREIEGIIILEYQLAIYVHSKYFHLNIYSLLNMMDFLELKLLFQFYSNDI